MKKPGKPISGTEKINDQDKRIIDVVLKALYGTAHKQALDFEREILAPNKIILAPDAVERIWVILLGTEWVSPEVGFGNAGKLALTHQGMQLMLQFGGYYQYLEATGKLKPAKTIVQHIGPQNDKDIKPLQQINTTDAPKKHKGVKKIN